MTIILLFFFIKLVDYSSILKKIFDNQDRICPIVKFITDENLKTDELKSTFKNTITSTKLLNYSLDEFQNFRFSRPKPINSEEDDKEEDNENNNFVDELKQEKISCFC